MAKHQLAAQTSPTGSTQQQPKMYVPKEQIAYAKMINYGAVIGIILLTVTFAAYVSGLVPGFVSPEQVAANWNLSAEEFLQATNAPHGWAWLSMLNYGNFLSLIGIAWLAGLTILAYLMFLVPAYLKQKDVPFLTIAITEVIVLIVAASGILGTGGH